jgi:hypothetical protein|tara:strand:+ start:341 stop:625 length:285 start_codon:yes stop_codon:yes gene_type:complete
MKPFRFYKNIRKPSHTIFTHCFIFFVNNGVNEETFILRDLETDFEGVDYDKYIYKKEKELYSKYDTNVKIEGSRLGLWEYEQLLELGIPKLCLN